MVIICTTKGKNYKATKPRMTEYIEIITKQRRAELGTLFCHAVNNKYHYFTALMIFDSSTIFK
jgi:hypothetical protein